MLVCVYVCVYIRTYVCSDHSILGPHTNTPLFFPLYTYVFLCSGIPYTSSEEEDDCDSPFDGLTTQHTLKMPHRDGLEDGNPEGVEPQGTAHQTSPSTLSDRAAAYVSGSLGADSTTHQDLSSAGLEGDGESGRVRGWRVRWNGVGSKRVWWNVSEKLKLPAVTKGHCTLPLPLPLPSPPLGQASCTGGKS